MLFQHDEYLTGFYDLDETRTLYFEADGRMRCEKMILDHTGYAFAAEAYGELTIYVVQTGVSAFNISDVTGILNLLSASAADGYPDYTDYNNDGAIDISDVTWLLNFLAQE